MKTIFLEGNFCFGHKCKASCFSQIFSTNLIGKWFLIIKRPRYSRNYFCGTSCLWKKSFKAKKFEIDPPNMFPNGRLSFLCLFHLTIRFFFKFLCNKHMIYIHMFLNNSYSKVRGYPNNFWDPFLVFFLETLLSTSLLPLPFFWHQFTSFNVTFM